MQHNIERSTTNRGAPAIIFDRQKYRLRCMNKDGSELWVCCNKSCGISLLLNNGIIKRYPLKHMHDEIESTFEVREMMQKVYDESKQNLLKPVTQIYQQNLKEYKRKYKTAAEIPIFERIRSTAYRRRASVLPRIPRSLSDITIPESLKITDNEDQFVIFDNPAPHRLITLGSPQALECLGM